MNKIDGRKLIMNVSSFSATVPTPMLNVYGASKVLSLVVLSLCCAQLILRFTQAYMNQWTETLSPDLAENNIDVVGFYPYFIVSAMSGFRK
jgi:short-subunit dehydrogenase